MTIRFDNFTCVAVPPAAPLDCLDVGVVAALEFDSDDDVGVVVKRGGDFTPARSGERLRLLEEGLASSAVAVWYPIAADPGADGIPLLDDGFRAEFDLYLTHSGASSPADGLTFAAIATGQNDGLGTALGAFPPGLDIASLGGDAGGSMGYSGGTIRQRAECHPSFAVEIDLWVGGGNNEVPDGGSPGNPGRWHTGINVDGYVDSLQTSADYGVPSTELPDLFAPDGVHVEVVYRANGQIETWVAANDGSVARVQTGSVEIEPLPSGDVILGFTGGTGGATVTAEIDNVILTALCCETSDIVEISGDTIGINEAGIAAMLSAEVTGIDEGGAPVYSWEIVSGDASIVSADDEQDVLIQCESLDDVVVRVTAGDGVCDDVAVDEYTLLCACPTEGDTHCDGLSFTGPEGNLAGPYTLAASGTDDSGDDVIYHFAADNGIDEPMTATTTGIASAVFDLDAGLWTLSVTVDDDPACPDEAGDATCSIELEILPSTPFIRGDCNQDGEVCRNVSDLVASIALCFLGGPEPACPAACDANGDGVICGGTADIVYLAVYCFIDNSAPPPAPYPDCGSDETTPLRCDAPTACTD